jgi:hypothetical protein
MAYREPERQYSLSLLEVFTPFLLVGVVFAVAVLLTVH